LLERASEPAQEGAPALNADLMVHLRGRERDLTVDIPRQLNLIALPKPQAARRMRREPYDQIIAELLNLQSRHRNLLAAPSSPF
jgi:hypothetical protein